MVWVTAVVVGVEGGADVSDGMEVKVGLAAIGAEVGAKVGVKDPQPRTKNKNIGMSR